MQKDTVYLDKLKCIEELLRFNILTLSQVENGLQFYLQKVIEEFYVYPGIVELSIYGEVYYITQQGNG